MSALSDDEWDDPVVNERYRELVTAETAEPPPPELHWKRLQDFVEDFIKWYRREVFDSRERVWCPDWWRHPEAVVRLEAMWRTCEPARIATGGDGISAWLRDHVDVHMAQLMHPQGPFRGCSAKGGHSPDPLPALPVTPVPDGWWTEADSGL